VIVVTGVSGSGKTTLAARLGHRLGAPVLEGDDYHPKSNVQKMASGIALCDEDRWPWLDRLVTAIQSETRQHPLVICTCSALKRNYRDRLRAAIDCALTYVYLYADRAVLERRLALRAGHFMPASLLGSQLDALEEPQCEEGVIAIASEGEVDTLVDEVLRQLPPCPSNESEAAGS
jgi:gluconokinase